MTPFRENSRAYLPPLSGKLRDFPDSILSHPDKLRIHTPDDRKMAVRGCAQPFSHPAAKRVVSPTSKMPLGGLKRGLESILIFGGYRGSLKV